MAATNEEIKTMKTYRTPIYLLAILALFTTACTEAGCESADRSTEDPAAVVDHSDEADTSAYRPENGELKFESK